MTNAKNVYALMLALVIVLSGCFGMTGDESDAQDSESDENENSGGTGSTFSGADNLPPVISVSVGSSTEFYEGADCTSAGISVEVRHAMTDWDGTIQQAGWDIDLDGTIDYFVTADEGYTTLEMPISAMIWHNTSGFGETEENSWMGSSDYAYLQNSFAFGVQDDDGEFVSSEIFMVQKAAYTETSAGEVTSNMDVEACRDFTDAADYTFNYSDNPDMLGGSMDYLVDITRTNGQAAISWDSIRIFFDGNQDDSICGISTSNCRILQSGGSDDSMWEPGETITIREQGENLHYESLTHGSEYQMADIEIMLLVEGTTNDYAIMDSATLEII